MKGDTASVDISTEKNLNSLVGVGKRLLKRPPSMVNVESSRFEEVKDGGTNEDALANFAKMLSEERRSRMANLKGA